VSDYKNTLSGAASRPADAAYECAYFTNFFLPKLLNMQSIEAPWPGANH